MTVKDNKGRSGDDRAEVDFSLDARTFRHFSFRGKEYYYIQAYDFYGSGSIVNVCYHLIYSVAHKKLAKFYTCRFSSMLFGDVNGDEDLDYLDFDNAEFCPGTPSSDNVGIRLYSCDKKGSFRMQKDASGKPFYIEGRTGADYRQDSFIIENAYWPFING